jgi:glutamate-1-semialdehyde 2,1-aminomutase
MMEELRPSLYEHLDRMGERLRNGLRNILADIGIRAQVVGISSIFHIFFTEERIRDSSQAAGSNVLLTRIFELGCQNNGVNLAKNHCSFLSSPMTEKEIDQTLEVMKKVLTDMLPTVKTTAPILIRRD